jgi:diguanylate cyclase (GGDEF)-like protein/PAS domain S-box-containing protein
VKLSSKFHLFSLSILIVMTFCVLAAGIFIINELAQKQHRQILQVKLEKVRETVSDTLNRSGVSSAAKAAERLQSELRAELGLNSIHIFVVEAPDRVIFHPELQMGERIERDDLESLLELREGAVEYTEDGGDSHFAVYTTIQPIDWMILLSIDEDEMYAKEAAYFRNITLIAFGLFAICALVVSLFVRRFISRLQFTLDCIKDIENGDLETRIPIEADDEVGQLQAGVNSLSAKIQQRTLEQLRAERAKHFSEEKYQQLFATANEGIWIQDENYRTTMINEHMAQMLGYTAAEIQGRKVTDFMFDEDVNDHAKKIEERSRNISDVYERRMRHKDGSTVWMLISATPIFDDGRFRGSFAMLTDITERKIVEQQLAASEHLFRTLVENSPDPISRYDLNLRRVYINPALQKLFTVPVENALGRTPKNSSPLIDHERYMNNLRRAIETGQEISDEIAYRSPQDALCWASARFAPEFDTDGKIQSVLVISNDTTEQKLAEAERLELLHFLESLDRINRVLQEEGDIEQILNRTLDEVLDIFDCDRAYLQYPCDPAATSEWRMPMERCKPDYPSQLPPGRRLPYHPHLAEILSALLASDTPVRFGPNSERPIPSELMENLGVRSLMAVALHPKVDRPWQFGVHQCSHDRIWSDQEARLLEEIGRRLSDRLNNLLITRNLSESEARLRLVFENSPVSIQEEDYSVVKSHLESLRPQFGEDLAGYLTQHPEVLEECAGLVRIIEINQAALALHEAESKEAVLAGLSQIFLPETMPSFRDNLLSLMRGETNFRRDSVLQTLNGHRYHIDAFFSVCPGYEDNLGKVLVSLIDISELKRAEQVRQLHLHFLESLDRVNRVLQGEGNIEQIMDKALREVRSIFECDRAYLLYPCDPQAPSYAVPIESTTSKYPGAGARGMEVPMDDFVSSLMRTLLDSDHSLKLGAGTDIPISDFLREEFSIRSFLAVALRPRVDRPWQFGIHQCSYDRVWSDQEMRLFEEIGHRLSDGLNDLLITRNLRESEERFRLVYENSPVPIWEEDFSAVKQRLEELKARCGGDLEAYLLAHPAVVKECASLVRIENVNSATLELHEADSEEALYEGLQKTFIPESYDAFRKELVALSRGETELLFDGVVQTLSGKRREVSVSFSVCPGYEQSLSKVFVSLFDITQRKQDEDHLRLAASVFSTSQEGILISNADNRIIDVNPAFTRLTGYSREEALGKDPSFLSAEQHQDQSFYARMWHTIETTGEWQGELWNQRKSGEVFPEQLSIVAVKDAQGRLQHYVGAFSDISMIKRHEADLDRIAHYDMLTSVPNRRLLSDRLEQALAHSQRHHTNLAVCYLDLDGFKPINDEYGHEIGDRMLIEIANRLLSMSRGEDTVARLGGDEFVLLWNDIGSDTDCHRALERILDKVIEPMLLEDISLSVSASIGVTLYPDDHVDADSLLRHADHAMYTAKQLGKNRFQIFDARLERQISARQELLEKIERGQRRGQFELYYQPKLDYTTCKVVGVESLLRWNDPVLGLLGPKEFLSLIENDNLAFKMGCWIIGQALQQAKVWDKIGITLPISVNIFPRHLKYRGFIDDLRHAIENYWPQMPKNRLIFEIVESTDLEELEPTEQVIRECVDMGIGFSLDDFGTGYSSLVYLRRLSIEELKIDQSFVRDMLEDPNDEAIVVGVISLGQAFGLRVVAEGVETARQAEHLVKLGCSIVQGFGLGRPMPAHAFEQWLADFDIRELKLCRK